LTIDREGTHHLEQSSAPPSPEEFNARHPMNFPGQKKTHHDGVEVAGVIARKDKASTKIGSARKKTQPHRVVMNVTEKSPTKRVKHLVR
jgi:hypothetical protein